MSIQFQVLRQTGKSCIAFILLLFFMLGSQAQAAEGLHIVWTDLLGKHVHGGVVDYQGFKKDEAQLDSYLAILESTDPEKLEEMDRLALYLNAYNAYTVKLILNNFKNGKPVDSIKDIGGLFSSPWSIKFCKVGGKTYTLDNIEHDIIRPQFKEPRVHFAVNCASQSCPPLIPEAYVGARLDEQLQTNTVSFINDTEFNYLDGSTLYISKIFSWFKEDFDENIVDFIRRYAREEVKNELNALGDKVKVKYLKYDWSLNDK